MTHYYIKSCYIKNRTAFIASILGCINRELVKMSETNYNKSKDVCEALGSLSYALMITLRVENDPSTIFNSYDTLEFTDWGSLYSQIQEKADKLAELLEDDIAIHFTGKYSEITTEYEEWLPSFNGKIKLLFE